MDAYKATEIAYKNGYAAGRESILRETNIYALGEGEHITRCQKCKTQLIFNHTHVRHECYINRFEPEYLDIITCPKCNSDIVITTGII